MLYIEAPVGVGFSYSTSDQYDCDDDRTAKENRAAVEHFFTLFPDLKKNKFFVTGESYAGVYVPTLVETILEGEQDGSYTGAPLSGMAAGNGCSGTEVGICSGTAQGTAYEWEFLAQTAFITKELKQSIAHECDWEAAEAKKPDALSSRCKKLLATASVQIGPGIDLYNIYGDCVTDSGCSASLAASKPKGLGKINSKALGYHQALGATAADRVIPPHGPSACINSKEASTWLNKPDVQAAIHVRDPGYCWSVCGSQPGWSYKSTRPNLPRDTYPFLVQNTHVLIFNGDWDACVPHTDGYAWTTGMNLPVSNPWHAWTYTSASGAVNQTAGYAVQFDVSAARSSRGSNSNNSGKGKFTFTTVRGGRHEVPESAPQQALEMLTRLINGEDF
jgi:carboxypeptidase C (cathepsin A)